jgi:pyruvate dehydrogenase E2 component (dihydrolipoamide acetyltransferase)
VTVVERRELTGTRRIIADRLSESAQEKPHVMGTREIGIERAEALVERVDRETDGEVALNDLLVLAVARTLADFPEFNARHRDGAHELLAEVNVGYAVDTDKGLVVPVLRDADDKDLATLGAERRAVVERTLADEHDPADLKNGTFTVTNVGVFGMDVSYSIINPPQVAILALGRRKPVPVECDGGVKFERGLTASLTIDHCVLDGSDSGAFLARLDDYLQRPATLVGGLPGE